MQTPSTPSFAAAEKIGLRAIVWMMRPNVFAFADGLRVRAPLRLRIALSRRKQGFESPRERQWFQRCSGIRGLSVGNISNFSPMDGAFEDWFEATLRSSARGGRRLAQSPPSRHRCLLIKMTRARIAARSAEQIEPNAGIAGLAAAGSAENAAIPASASILPRSWH
jgi:hypothetical protein